MLICSHLPREFLCLDDQLLPAAGAVAAIFSSGVKLCNMLPVITTFFLSFFLFLCLLFFNFTSLLAFLPPPSPCPGVGALFDIYDAPELQLCPSKSLSKAAIGITIYSDGHRSANICNFSLCAHCAGEVGVSMEGTDLCKE